MKIKTFYKADKGPKATCNIQKVNIFKKYMDFQLKMIAWYRITK